MINTEFKELNKSFQLEDFDISKLYDIKLYDYSINLISTYEKVLLLAIQINKKEKSKTYKFLLNNKIINIELWNGDFTRSLYVKKLS